MSNSKTDLLDAMGILYNQVDRLRIIAEEKELNDEASRLQVLKEKLREMNDELLRGAYEDWTRASQALLAKLQAANQELKDAIADLEKESRIIEKVVTAIGKIEDLVQAAGKLFPRLRG